MDLLIKTKIKIIYLVFFFSRKFLGYNKNKKGFIALLIPIINITSYTSDSISMDGSKISVTYTEQMPNNWSFFFILF